MKCQHHKCRSEFEPTHVSQAYCSATCKRAAHNWRAMRGSVLVTAVLNGCETASLIENLKREYADG